MAPKKKIGRPSVGLGETQIFVRVTEKMKAQLARVVAKRSKTGAPTTAANVVREYVAAALEKELAS